MKTLSLMIFLGIIVLNSCQDKTLSEIKSLGDFNNGIYEDIDIKLESVENKSSQSTNIAPDYDGANDDVEQDEETFESDERKTKNLKNYIQKILEESNSRQVDQMDAYLHADFTEKSQNIYLNLILKYKNRKLEDKEPFIYEKKNF